MLSLLLDEQISHVVMNQVRNKQPDKRIHSILVWRGGALRGQPDEIVLSAAWQERLTLVTYDQKTIAPLLRQWAMEGRDHAGVIFIDQKSIPQRDVGGQVRALLALWDSAAALNWANSIAYLKPTR